jgi:hypothetical protein
MGISEVITELFAKRPFPEYIDTSSPQVRWQYLTIKLQQAKKVVDSISREGYSESAGKKAEAALAANVREQSKYWGSTPEVKLSARDVRNAILYKYDQTYAGLLAHDPVIVAFNQAQGLVNDNIFRDDMIARWRILDSICAIDDYKASISQATSGLGNPLWIAVGIIVFVGLIAGAIWYLGERYIDNRAMVAAIDAACSSGKDTPACRLAIEELRKSTEDNLVAKVTKYAIYGGIAYVLFNIIMARESSRFSRGFR